MNLETLKADARQRHAEVASTTLSSAGLVRQSPSRSVHFCPLVAVLMKQVFNLLYRKSVLLANSN